MDKYLTPSKYIDFDTPAIATRARELSVGTGDQLGVVSNCFEFVRDQIKHSWDYKMNPMTCKASDVLKHGTGYCYAKSHLLAALLRANGVPAGLCYQRLTITDKPPFCIHGLNAVYLNEYGWYRVDPRGNKKGVSAGFSPPIENLAFPLVTHGEADLPEIWSEPLSAVTDVLERFDNFQQVADNLPDVELVATTQWQGI